MMRGIAIGVFSLLIGWPPAVVCGQQFRIESSIYADGSSHPVSDNLTLFDGDLVYDFLLVANQPTQVTEIAIYQAAERRFTLLDTTRRVRVELRQADLEQMLKNLTASEAFQDEMRFLVDPKFVAEFDAIGKKLELRSDHLVYTVQGGDVADEESLAAYFRFIEAYTLLNATEPRRIPPFARMRLNQEMKDRRIVPARVEMVMEIPGTVGRETRRIQATSSHALTGSLTEQDRDRIAQANRFAGEYEPTSLGAYRRLDSRQAAAKQR